MSNPKTICLFHKDCIDGTAAAAVVLKKFPNTKFFPFGHDYTEDSLTTIAPDLEEATKLIIVDGSWGVEWFLNNFPSLSITLIDHHVSNSEKLHELVISHKNLKLVFDLNHCATVLAWKYFFPDETQPEIMKHIEDGDLWLKKYEADTPNVTAVLSIYRNQPDNYLKLFSADLAELKKQGSYISEYVQSSIEKFIKIPPVKINIGDHEVLAFNITEQQSVCGNLLATEHNQAVALFTIKGDVVRLSFRSTDKHSPSALELATKLSGGGHRNSSGGQMTLREFIENLVRGE